MLHLFQPLTFSSHRVATTSEHPGRQTRNTKGRLKSPQPSEKYKGRSTTPNHPQFLWLILGVYLRDESKIASLFMVHWGIPPGTGQHGQATFEARSQATLHLGTASKILNYPGKKQKRHKSTIGFPYLGAQKKVDQSSSQLSFPWKKVVAE